MTNAQKVALRLSKVRERLNEISGLEAADFSDEIRTEAGTLQAEYSDLEIRHRAAIVAEPPETVTEGAEDGEAVEIRKLRPQAKLADSIVAAITGKPVAGASGEYADAMGCPGYTPLDLVLGGVETRAVTPGPDAETVTATRPTVPAAFARTDAAALGIAMPMVQAGEAHFPALTTAPPAGPKAKDAAADATAAAFALTKRVPGRITGQFVIRLEDLALLPSMETDLRTAIGAAMADNLDAQVVSGSGVSPNLSGLFNQATDVNAAGAVETFATGVARFAALIDGTHANGWGDVRVLIGTSTFAKYAGLFQSNGDVSLFDYLSGKLGALRVSTRVPAVSSMAQKALAVLGAQGQPVTVPIWSGVELIVDPYSNAAQGQRVVTAVTLVGSPFVPYGASQVVEIHPKLS